MASANAVFTEMVTTTLREHPSKLTDNVSHHNAMYRRMTQRGNTRTVDGGYEIVENLDYEENSTYQRYSGYEILNVQASDVLSAAKFDWKQAAVHVTASGRQIRQNSGKNQIIDLAEARIKNASRTFANNMSIDLYSTGAADGGKQVGGLQHLITNDGTGTVGGINATNFPFWRNQFKDGNSATSSTIRARMQELWLDCVRGQDKPDLIMSSNDLYQIYWESLTDLQRFTSAQNGESGFRNELKFVDADVAHDSSESGIPNLRMYFLNTEYLKVVAHRDADMEQLDEKMSINQDAVVIPIIWMGNLTCSNRARQGVLFD